MRKALRIAAVLFGALVLSSSLALAQTTPPPSGTDQGKTPTTGQTATKTVKKAGKKPGTKKTGTKKKGTKTGTTEPGKTTEPAK
jgi:hypothetical protein